MNLLHNRADDPKPTAEDITLENIVETAQAMGLKDKQITIALESIAKAEEEE